MAAGTPVSLERDWKVTLAAVTMLAAGLAHIWIVPHHWEHAPAHGLAMLAIGVLDVAWAVLYWLKPSPRLAQTGVVLGASSIALWAITRISPAPFTNEAEEVDLAGVLTKLLEAISVGALLAALPFGRSGRRHVIITLLLLSLLLAVGLYQVGLAVQPLFPQLGPPGVELEHTH